MTPFAWGFLCGMVGGIVLLILVASVITRRLGAHIVPVPRGSRILPPEDWRPPS